MSGVVGFVLFAGEGGDLDFVVCDCGLVGEGEEICGRCWCDFVVDTGGGLGELDSSAVDGVVIFFEDDFCVLRGVSCFCDGGAEGGLLAGDDS